VGGREMKRMKEKRTMQRGSGGKREKREDEEG